MFDIFNTDQDDRTECMLNMFADDAKLGGGFDTTDGSSAVQRSLKSLWK